VPQSWRMYRSAPESGDGMNRVLLVSMPFVSVRYPSPALSLLKSVLQENGVQGDVAYLNVIFQAYVGNPEIYEAIADFMIVGETVFGRELFGEQWSQSDRGRLAELDAPLLPAGSTRDSIRDTLLRLRAMAGPFLQMCMSRINWDHYDIVGFTSVYSQQVASLALARHIKQRFPDKVIAFGGANCEEEMGRALLRLFPFVDWVFNGEADVSFPLAVTRRLEDGTPPENIPGVFYRRNGEIVAQGRGQSPELDALPYPDFDEYFKVLKKWTPDYLSVASLSLELSRGCWWGKKSQCIFCGLNCKHLDYRRKSPKRAETEIKALTGRYGVDRVILTDSVLDMTAFKTFLPALADWGGLEELFLEARAVLNRDQLRMLKAAGVKSFQPGIESLDSEVLTLMHKGTTLLQNIQFLKWSRELDFFPTWNLLYGFPGESPDAYKRMADLIPAILHLQPPMDVSPMLLVRFSPLFEQGQEWGVRRVRAHRGYRSVYPFEDEDLNDLANFFDFDCEGRDSVSAYIGPLEERVQTWKLSWEQPQPPSLTYRQLSGLQLAIFDTRPGQRRQQVVLKDEVALAYAGCEAAQPFERLASSVRSRLGETYPGDAALRRQLDQLVSDRFMLREDDRFLSLAVKPGQAAEASEEW
jgi:ribosomal peptide maturation radical SAM protein 1